MDALLTVTECDELVDLCHAARVPDHPRDLRFHGFPPGLTYRLDERTSRKHQLDSDIIALNRAGLVEGFDNVPLAAWLERAARQVDPLPKAAELRRWAHLVRARAAAQPNPIEGLVSIEAPDRHGRTFEGVGALIAPDRVLTAWSLIADDERLREGCTVTGPDGVVRQALPDRQRSHSGAGWATLRVRPPLHDAQPMAIGRWPVPVGAAATIGFRAAYLVDPDLERGYDPVMEWALGGPPAMVPPGTPVIVDGGVVGVALGGGCGRFIDAARGEDLAELLDTPDAPASDDLDGASGPLGRAIQINRESQWYKLLALVRREQSGLILLHGDARQALHHFIERMQRDLGNTLHEPIVVARVPYLRSAFGSPPKSAEDWSFYAATTLGRSGDSTIDVLKAACDETRFVLVLEAPVRPGSEVYDKALITDFVEREAPRLLASAVAHHRLHIVVAIAYRERDSAFLKRLNAGLKPRTPRAWRLDVLKQVQFPDWDDDVEPFLAIEGVSELDRVQLEALYRELAKGDKCFDRLARAIQAVLDKLDRR